MCVCVCVCVTDSVCSEECVCVCVGGGGSGGGGGLAEKHREKETQRNEYNIKINRKTYIILICSHQNGPNYKQHSFKRLRSRELGYMIFAGYFEDQYYIIFSILI